MADTRPAFAGTEDANGNGIPTGNALDATTTAAGLNGQIGFAFKDSTGKVVLPQLTASGKIKVDTEASNNVVLSNRGTAAGSATPVPVATITLAASTLYGNLEMQVSCRHGGYFQLVWNNNAVLTVIADVLLDAGQYTFKSILQNFQFTSGGTGTQQLLLNGNNWGSGSGQLSNMYATITAEALVA